MSPFWQDLEWVASLQMQKVETSKSATPVGMLVQVKPAIKPFTISTVSELVRTE